MVTASLRSASPDRRPRTSRPYHWALGSDALTWPHRTITLDTLHGDLVGLLVRSGRIQWPGGHTDLEVLDVWRGRQGCRYLTQATNSVELRP